MKKLSRNRKPGQTHCDKCGHRLSDYNKYCFCYACRIKMGRDEETYHFQISMANGRDTDGFNIVQYDYYGMVMN